MERFMATLRNAQLRVNSSLWAPPMPWKRYSISTGKSVFGLNQRKEIVIPIL
jgi:hypothetical protein